jgi:HAD superfamily hydrolase (TIGR01509 family)
MIRALIFDCFGVLTTDGWLPFKEEQFGRNQALMDEATALNQQSAAGLISYDDFVQGIADLANMPSMQVMQALEGNAANRKLFDYIKTAKDTYKIGLLSNAAADLLDDLFEPEDLAVFDATALSYEMGFVKPDPRAYEVIAERLGVEPEACVMIDDQERYADAARDIGMQTVWYRGFEQMRRDLEKLLGNSKN